MTYSTLVVESFQIFYFSCDKLCLLSASDIHQHFFMRFVLFFTGVVLKKFNDSVFGDLWCAVYHNHVCFLWRPHPPPSNDWGHIDLGLSVYLSVHLSANFNIPYKLFIP